MECRGDDCNDARADVHPSIEDSCNGVDDDCDGVVDEGTNECGGACPLRAAVGAGCDGLDLDLCQDDQLTCDGLNQLVCGRGEDSSEVCNRVDDDCDGGVDVGACLVLDWARTAGGQGWQTPSDLTVAPDGGLLLVGSNESGAVTFGLGEPAEATVAASSFLARYEPNGDFGWVRALEGARINRVKATPSGEILVAGSFTGTVTFGAGTPHETTLSADPPGYSPGYRNGFFARFGPAGDFLGVEMISGVYDQYVSELVTLPDGGIVAAGYHGEAAIFAEGRPDVLRVSGRNIYSVFVAGWDPAGALSWEKTYDANNHVFFQGLAAMPDGGVMLGLRHFGRITIDRGEPNEQTLSSTVGAIELIRLGPGGETVWVRSMDSSGSEDLGAVEPTADGGALVVGGFQNALTLDGSAGPIVLQSVGGRDAMAARIGPDGVFLWASSAGGAGNDFAQRAALAPDGGWNWGGSFEETASFGVGQPMFTTLTAGPASSPEGFLSKLDSGGGLAWVKAIGADATFTGMGVAPSGSVALAGSYYVSFTLGVGEFRETALPGPDVTDLFVASFLPAP